MRFRLTVAYDGRPFCGWQSQADGGSIQDHLQAATREVCGTQCVVHGSGRTDAGVHALAQVAHFDAPSDNRMDAVSWMRALNTKIPRTIRVTAAEEVDETFHARFSATGKSYRYRIYLGDPLPPNELGHAWHIIKPIDQEKLAAALKQIEGKHDFGAFAAARGEGSEPGSYLRTIRATSLDSRPHELGGEVITMTFTGDGFLYKMVRLLSGAIGLCGQGKLPPETIIDLLSNGGATPPKKSPLCAPADGLSLVKVYYSE